MTPDQTQDAINHCVGQAMAQYRLPGLASAVVQNDTVLQAGGFGHSDPQLRCPIDSQTVFGVASLTKLVTAAIIMQLDAGNQLSIHDRLDKFFPALTFGRERPVQLTHLLSHSGGFPGLPFRFQAHNADDAADRSGGLGRSSASDSPESTRAAIHNAAELAEQISASSFDWLARPGEWFNYSNEGFCLLGGVAEQVTNRPFAVLAQALVFAPLKMSSASIGEPAAQCRSNTAWPMLRIDGQNRTGTFWQAPLFYPAGGTVASALDIARLIRLLSPDTAMLPPAQLRAMTAPVMPIPSRPHHNLAYGYGLEIHRVDQGPTIIWHSGQRAGVSSFMAWLPEESLSISVLSNVTNAPMASIGHRIIGTILARTDIDWPPRVLTKHSPIASPAQSDQLCGQYGSAEGNCVDIANVDGELALRTQAQAPWQPMQFYQPDSGVVDGQTFRCFGGDKLALDLRTLPRVASQSV